MIYDEFYLENYLEKDRLTFILSENDYKNCDEHSHNTWINKKKKSTYNNGFFNNKEDSIRIGNCGEYTISRLFKITSNFATYIEFGDGGVDLILNNNKTCDVKTTTFNDKFFIRYINEDYKVIPLKSDIYIANRVIEERKQDNYIKIQIMGWQTKKYLMKNKNLSEGFGKNATHANINCRFEKLRPINELF